MSFSKSKLQNGMLIFDYFETETNIVQSITQAKKFHSFS